jgi:hypothetical protein
MRAVLHAHRCADLNEALLQALPFKIPVADAKLVQLYPNVFELSASTVDLAVRSFLEHSKIGQSETSTVIIDGHWLKALRRCLNGVYILQNEHDESSIQAKRPDSSVQVFSALALKGEAKFSIADLPIAFGELTSKFHRDAYKVFPKGCNSIVGITSCIDRIDMNIITYKPETRGYTATMYRGYEVDEMPDRVAFLVDLMKVCRWMASITECNSAFHLTPNVRRKTNNGHHITWTVEGIFKEFDKHRDMTAAMMRMEQVYNQNPPLLHVEHGRIVNRDLQNQSILITRLGNRLTLANMTKLRLTKEMVIAQVGLGLVELHNIGLAHCDISVENVFIDDQGVVFLDDLEYLTPMNDPAPHYTRLPAGVTENHVQNAFRLDELQFRVFSAEVNRM